MTKSKEYRYLCPKCGHGVTLYVKPKYPPTCESEERHHSNRVYEMELFWS